MKRGLGVSHGSTSGVLGKAQNEAWKRGLGVSHGSQEWGGKDGIFCCWRFPWSTKAIAAALDLLLLEFT